MYFSVLILYFPSLVGVQVGTEKGKIMAEFREVIKQKERICNVYDGICSNCPISSDNNGKNLGCGSLILCCPEEAEERIMKWADEHPIKTNADMFKEVFGITPEKFGRLDWEYWNKEYIEKEV